MNADLASCRTLIDTATAGLDDQRAAIRLDGRWSVAEIVEHLDRTYTGTTKGLGRCLDAGSTRTTAPHFRGRLRRFLVVTLGWFPDGIQAPRHVQPSGEVSLSAVMSRVSQHLSELDAIFVRATAHFGDEAILDHPLLGPFTIADWARFHRVHTRHHCKQIRERRGRVERPD